MAVRRQRRTPDGGTTPAEVWGAELYHWRWTVRGMYQTALAEKMHCDPSYLSQLENGKRSVKERFAEQLDAALDTGGALTRQLAYLRQGISDYHPNWFRQYVELEGKAVAMREWHPYFMSGLLQTEEYARAVFTLHGEPPIRVDELTEARLSRQERLYGPDALDLTVVMDEGVLRRVAGDITTTAGQLRHLLDLSRRSNIALHVVPFGAGTPGPGSLMTFLDLPNRSRWFYTESLERGFCTDDQTEVMQQSHQYDRIRSNALSAQQSRTLIRRIMEELINMKPQPTAPNSVSWFKASYSGGGNGGCIEISTDLLPLGQVPIRDSKDPDGPNLLFPTEAFADFRRAVAAGEFTDGEQYVTP
ncbi:Scr1 family TA system antitoxin-like transcriptional regulator [Kitasatospora sp. NPDC050543]|uniref:Scr1 family TA system antitoxin-like transcriptional regulator n=1 Tax=Kitasatospora sp. NPDC050543 TaxID=3364054 RepID=UPI0037959379